MLNYFSLHRLSPLWISIFFVLWLYVNITWHFSHHTMRCRQKRDFFNALMRRGVLCIVTNIYSLALLNSVKNECNHKVIRFPWHAASFSVFLERCACTCAPSKRDNAGTWRAPLCRLHACANKRRTRQFLSRHNRNRNTLSNCKALGFNAILETGLWSIF